MLLLRQLAFLALLLSCALLVGGRVGGRYAGRSAVERAALSVALGLGVLGHVALALGLLGRLTPAVTAATLLALTLACLPGWRRGLTKAHGAAPQTATTATNATKATTATYALLAIALAATFALPLYPSTQWDAGSYHLPVARAMVDTGRVEPLPYLRYPVFPRHAEMLFALGLLIGDDREAQLTQWLAMATTALLVLGAGRSWFGARAGLWAAAAWLGSPLVLLLAGTAYVDVLLALFCTASAIVVVRAAEEDDVTLAAIAGALSGFAASTKYLGLVAAALWTVPLLLRRRVRPLLAYGLALVVAGAPWYLLDWHWAGNPLFPFLRTQLGADPYWNAEDHAGQMTDLHQYGTGRGLVALLRLPVDLVLSHRAFHSEQLLSPLLALGAAFAGLVALVPRLFPTSAGRSLRTLAGLTGLYLVAWFWSGAQIARYLLPLLPLASLITGAALDGVAGRARLGGRPWVMLGGALALASAGLLWTARELALRGLPPSSEAARDRYLTERMPAYQAFRHARAERPGERLQQIWLEDHLVYTPAGVEPIGDWFGPARHGPLLAATKDAASLHALLVERGAGWLVAPHPAFRGTVVLPTGDPRFPTLFELVFDSPAAALYRVRPAP